MMWRWAVAIFLGIASLAFANMPVKPIDRNLLQTHKTAGTTGANGKYEIESNAAVLAAAVGMKSSPPVIPTPPKPAEPKPQPKPTPFRPWRFR